jgi:hypothetical protein
MQPDYLVALDCLLKEALEPDPPPEPETNWDREPTVSRGAPKWSGDLYLGGDSLHGERKHIFAAGKKKLEKLLGEEGYSLSVDDYTGLRELEKCFGAEWVAENVRPREWVVRR